MSKNLLKSIRAFSSMTFISRILGFVRDMVVAQLFGAASDSDAFYIAFKIPNFMRRLFAEGAFSQAVMPVLMHYKAAGNEDALQAFIDYLASHLTIILLLFVGIGLFFAPYVLKIFAPGFEPERFRLATQMLRIMFPYLFFISLTAFAAAILNAYNLFGLPAITPVILNIVMIAAAFWFSPHFEHPIVGLAWSVCFAGILQYLFQLIFLHRLGKMPRFRFNRQHVGVKRVLKLMLPALIGVSVAQLGLLIDTLFASFLPIGSVSWLYYSDRLMNFPLGIFGVAIATVILPKLSTLHAHHIETPTNLLPTLNAPNPFSETLDWGLRLTLFIGLPAAAGLGLLALPLISTLFQYGAFSEQDVLMSVQA